MKSSSDLKPRPKWRLKKTLKRKPKFRPTQVEDLKFAWAAYKRGAFGDIFAEELSPQEFRDAFSNEVTQAYHAIWTLLADKPVGMVFGFWAHPLPKLAPYLILDRVVWFDWATPRTRVEGAVNFLNETRQDFPMIGFAEGDDKRFFEMICKHGIIRRVGTSHNLSKAVFETRK